MMTTLSTQLGKELKGMIKGSVLSADDPGYEEARQIWNAMIDRRPAMIVQCTDAEDVPTAIAFARRNRLEISIRGAGHNIAGNALCNDGLTIDFSNMKNAAWMPEKGVPTSSRGRRLRIWMKRLRGMA
jgi:FAD/FMN-containing dehydrogenase